MGEATATFEKWLKEKVDPAVEEKCDPAKLEAACLDAVKQIREEIIQGWYPYNWFSTHAATDYQQSSTKNGSIGSGGVTLTCHTDSQVESGKFDPPSLNWGYFGSHPQVTNDPQEWVLSLLMSQGIVGLPQEGIRTGWVNYNFKKAGTPLEAHFDSSGVWQKFEGLVKSKIL